MDYTLSPMCSKAIEICIKLNEAIKKKKKCSDIVKAERYRVSAKQRKKEKRKEKRLKMKESENENVGKKEMKI